MRSFYETVVRSETSEPLSHRHVRLFLQLAILAFWTPCIAVDGFVLWRSGGLETAGGFVFDLLFRQSLVFLALWFTVSITHGLAVGRQGAGVGRRPRRRRVWAAAMGRSLALVRYNRGQ